MLYWLLLGGAFCMYTMTHMTTRDDPKTEMGPKATPACGCEWELYWVPSGYAE